MADDADQHSKTEDPTDRKLNKLKEQGNVPTSREVNHVFALLGMLLVVWLAAPWSLQHIGGLTQATFENAGTTRLNDPAAIGTVLVHALFSGMVALLPILLLLLVLGYIGGVAQNGGILSSHPIQPNLEKISIIAGIKRMFSLKQLAELLKSIFKLAIIGYAMWWVVEQDKDVLVRLIDSSLGIALTATQLFILKLVGAAFAIMLLLAIIDYLFQRMQFLQQHRMTKHELKEEFKESDGDPHVKARQRQIRNERARKRMMSAVPKADVVITNPTHYSVALRYKVEEGDAAPIVVAKGVDTLAMRIREVAREHNVPLYEDPPLARQLYAQVEIDEQIPIQLYDVVAKVIAFVMDLKRRRRAS